MSGINESACYEAGAELYAEAGEDDPDWRERHRADFSRMLNGPTVADMGCGPGFDLAAFAAMGLKTVGIDGSAALLKFAARNSPASLLIHQDLRLPLGRKVDGLWSMFALLHIPEPDLVNCLKAWRQSLPPGAPLMLGLVESGVLAARQVDGWLDQPVPCVFYYHTAERVQGLLATAGFSVVSSLYDTPKRYQGGVYNEFKLSAYVICARSA
jgi:SAM-dependent methyltransferase